MPSIGQYKGKSARVTLYWFSAFAWISAALPAKAAVSGFGTQVPLFIDGDVIS